MKQLNPSQTSYVSGAKLDNKQISALVAGAVYLGLDAAIVAIAGSTPQGFVVSKLGLPGLKLAATYAGFEVANWYTEA